MLIYLIVGCVDDKDSGQPVVKPDQIVDWSAWKFADSELDPLKAHQPDAIDCKPAAMRMEGEQLEIQTDLCNYAFLEWDANQEVTANSKLEFLILHTGLWAPEAAIAHFALMHQDIILWESEFPVPSSGDFFYSELELENRIDAGDAIRIHLHNHGPNDWKLGYLKPPVN